MNYRHWLTNANIAGLAIARLCLKHIDSRLALACRSQSRAVEAAAYSPDPEGVPSGDGSDICLPFTLPEGELIAEVWERWLAHDPVRMVEQEPYARALRSLNLLYLDAGDRDEFALHLGARIFIERLKALNVPYHYEEFSDGHFGINYRYKVSLEMMARELGKC